MTSQLNVDTIVDKAGSGGTNVKVASTSTYVDGSATQNTVKSLGKAWFRYQQSANNIHNSFNISSISDDATGQYTATYTNNFNSDDDVTIVSALHSGVGNRSAQLTSIVASNFLGRSFNGTSATDLTVGFASLGDLA